MRPLLSIAIPTFNRVECLKLLLSNIFSQIDNDNDLLEVVEVIVSDNCSSDGTAEYLNITQKPYLRKIFHTVNYGADSNIECCFDEAKGKYVWIVGDDDLILDSVICAVRNYLVDNQVSLLYMSSKWINGPLNRLATYRATQRISSVSAETFSVTVGTMLTFISGMIVNKSQFERLPKDIKTADLANTNLLQLRWVLPLLNEAGDFAINFGVGILARSNNTGGYKLIRVFCHNYPTLLGKYFSEKSRIYKILIFRLIVGYIPGLIWNVRFARLGDFEESFSAKEVVEYFGQKLHFGYTSFLSVY